MMDDADRENLSNEAAAVRLSSCLITDRSVALMLVAPPGVVVALRFILPSTWPDTGWIACILAGVIGLLGIIFAPWREPVKVAAAGAYMLGALALLWQVVTGGRSDSAAAMRTFQGWRSGEAINDGLPDRW